MKSKFFLFVVFVFVCSMVSKTNAQDAILFQFPSSTPQINAALAAGDKKAVAMYKRSDNQIKQAIIKSFRAEFTYCPIYFFSSDDYDFIKAKEFDKASFFNNRAEEVKLPKGFTKYGIANISFFPRELKKVKRDGEDVYEEGVESHFGKGVILNDKAFNPVKGKLRFTPCKIAKRGSVFSPNKRYYVFRGAASFNKRLFNFGRK